MTKPNHGSVEYSGVVVKYGSDYKVHNNELYTTGDYNTVTYRVPPPNTLEPIMLVHNHAQGLNDAENNAQRYPSMVDWSQMEQAVSSNPALSSASLVIVDTQGVAREFPYAQ